MHCDAEFLLNMICIFMWQVNLLAVENQFVQHVAVNVVVLISKFMFTSVCYIRSGFYEVMLILCLCIVYDIYDSL